MNVRCWYIVTAQTHSRKCCVAHLLTASVSVIREHQWHPLPPTGCFYITEHYFMLRRCKNIFRQNIVTVTNVKKAMARLLPVFVSKCTWQQNKNWTTIRLDCRKSWRYARADISIFREKSQKTSSVFLRHYGYNPYSSTSVWGGVRRTSKRITNIEETALLSIFRALEIQVFWYVTPYLLGNATFRNMLVPSLRTSILWLLCSVHRAFSFVYP